MNSFCQNATGAEDTGPGVAVSDLDRKPGADLEHQPSGTPGESPELGALPQGLRADPTAPCLYQPASPAKPRPEAVIARRNVSMG